MKIRINDEYSNLGEEFNIILDEYSNEQEIRPDDIENDIESGAESCNTTYYEAEDTGFNVQVQYSQEGSYKEEESKYHEYDKFYYENALKGNKLNCDQNGNDTDYEKYYDGRYDEKYAEKCEECEDSRITNNLSICPEELMEENGYGNDKQDCNTRYSAYLDNHNNCENNEDIFDGCNNNFENGYQPKPNCRKGRIEVLVKLGDKNGIEIKGAKINLYELNGVCPKLYESKLTDCNGKAIFENLENGCYRVISLVDRRYFEKPTYITWNEVTIDNCVKDACICVVNKIKPSCCRR